MTVDEPDKRTLAEMQYDRGYSDAQAGHSPSHLYGPYIEGYVAGKSEPRKDHDPYDYEWD